MITTRLKTSRRTPIANNPRHVQSAYGERESNIVQNYLTLFMEGPFSGLKVYNLLVQQWVCHKQSKFL